MPVLKKKIDKSDKQQLGEYKNSYKSYPPVLMHPDMRRAFSDRYVIIFLFAMGSCPRMTYHRWQLPQTVLDPVKSIRWRRRLVLNGEQFHLEPKVGYGGLQLGIERQ